MANSSLKEQIEAAKFALAQNQAIGNQPVGNQPKLVEPVPAQQPASAQPASAQPASLDQTSATALITRVKSLEEQVSNSQRDLHVLLQKIRNINQKQQSTAPNPNKTSSPAQKAKPAKSLPKRLLIAVVFLAILTVGLLVIVPAGFPALSLETMGITGLGFSPMPEWLKNLGANFASLL